MQSENGLENVQLEFMLLDWDRVTKNEVGGTEFKSKAKFSRVKRTTYLKFKM